MSKKDEWWTRVDRLYRKGQFEACLKMLRSREDSVDSRSSRNCEVSLATEQAVMHYNKMLCLGRGTSKRSKSFNIELMAYKIVTALRVYSSKKTLANHVGETRVLALTARSSALLCVHHGKMKLARNILEYARTMFDIDEACDINDEFWTLECAFCVVLLSRGDFARAELYLRRLAKLKDKEESTCSAETYSRHVLASYLIAVACSAQEKFQEANVWATSSIRRVKHLVDRARREDECGISGDAKTRATNRDIVERLHDTVLGPCLYLLAHLSMKSGRHDEAVSCFRLCSERAFRDSNCDARNGVVASLVAANELREAMRECRAYALLKSPEEGHSSALLNFATLHAEAGRHEDCRKILQYLLRSCEDRGVWKIDTESACDSRQNLPLVRPETVPCLDRSEIMHRIGDSCLRVGDPRSAIKAFEETMESATDGACLSEHAMRKCLFANLQCGRYEDAVVSSRSILNASSPSRRDNPARLGKRVAALLYGADALISLDQAQEAFALLNEASDIVDKKRRKSSSSSPPAERPAKRPRDTLNHDVDTLLDDQREKTRRRVRERVDVISKNNRALTMLCVGRDKEALEVLRVLTRRDHPELLSRNMQEQIHYNYALALWRCGQRTAACAYWLGARGFIAAIPNVNVDDEGASAMAAVKSSSGNYQRISILLEQQQLALSMEQTRRKSRARSSRSLVESHVRAATRSFVSTDLSSEDSGLENDVARAFDLENRVPLDQILRLDVTVLSHWRSMQEDAGLREGLMRMEKALSSGDYY